MDENIGKRFGKLTIVSFDHSGEWYEKFYLCKCDCGSKKVVRIKCLRRGDTKSCGCIQREMMRTRPGHRMSKTRFYRIYAGIRKRCLSETCGNYADYGGRGIKVLWKSFDEFKEDMYESYLQHINEFGERNTSINRVDNDGNYCKENCEWETCQRQTYKKRSSIMITYRGEVKCLAEWAKEYNVSQSRLRQRINKLGWSFDRAIAQ